ncbi:MAG: hypothetical protein RIS44_2552 [Pseudomonadota bacterium]|jgi:hypothetical protein
MRPGWNPTRRNKHAGTKAHGHGQNNRLTIPDSWARDPRLYYEKLTSYQTLCRQVASRELRFFVEPTRPDWFYPCTVDDICALLAHVDLDALSAFDFIVMRQPTRKQRILCPVWGRALFAFDIDKYSGSAIVIEAQTLQPILWPKTVHPESARELERLRLDGHTIERTRRGIQIRATMDSLRNTMLYRTLLHEIGHHVDHKRSGDQAWDGKTKSTKEDFAHRYAKVLFEHLAQQGVVPFAPVLDDQRLSADGLHHEWFRPSCP